MGLNIKNAEAERLVHELAGLTGESLTGAIATAAREKIERLRGERSRRGVAQRLLEIGRQSKSKAEPSWAEGDDPTAFLYDDATGLPR